MVAEAAERDAARAALDQAYEEELVTVQRERDALADSLDAITQNLEVGWCACVRGGWVGGRVVVSFFFLRRSWAACF